ncbi:type IV pilus twitching motility protein PilT [Oculatella sp. FACHB-28]|uniref:type IV pilus twitching motility protein PilT n=1 Tax=Cyanophyceae TaxID=3028117 RepID=UPI001685A8AC|nr:MULTISPECIES: type IV pilus twitching motility protein PilT [Cyanophyceae]MBD1868354.1 type IV pilus twitching motility protein PilT [Cyanobacteria bacterium FACHB-471]MBD1998347.1 type IV pilus twitching motility protein PilT [Leptolyngbya sp. FACHB-541]MBD2055677.1 type IV pilus twitching motility protein PilT [Oculatella sp. FACHB-28]MBD2067125.1 type IV pilus twitching motility protein PilT [Leptolyngbya sp. FACHB-671]
MTEAQRPLTPPPAHRVPPPPPPRQAAPHASAGATQVPSQTLGTPTATSVNTAPMTHEATAPAVKPPPPPAGHRPAAPPPVQSSRVNKVTPGSPTLAQLVKEAFDKGFSDIHAGVGEVPRFRNRGEMDLTDYPVTDESTFFSWLKEILSDMEIKRFKETLDFDGAAQYDFARVRVNLFDSLRGPALVMRLIPLKILTIEQLNLPLVFKDICHYHKGLVLVTGPTGSGKSTTMAAMVDYINKEMPKNIITIEDPIEYVHQSRKALIKQREVGIHTLEFDRALKSSLREDPDVILIGEMRDKETVNTALKAAQTGHLVMGTLHTNSAVKTIERILSLYEPDQQAPMRVAIAESLVAVIAQGLCRTTDGKRAAFHDIMINTDAIKDYIRRGEIDEVEAIIPRCTFDGMCTMNQSLYKLYEAGRITEETALEMSPKPNEMAQILRGRV